MWDLSAASAKRRRSYWHRYGTGARSRDIETVGRADGGWPADREENQMSQPGVTWLQIEGAEPFGAYDTFRTITSPYPHRQARVLGAGYERGEASFGPIDLVAGATLSTSWRE
jgi:hypothetical protein